MASSEPGPSAPPDEGAGANAASGVKKGSKHACERCRKSKLRCLLDTVEQSGKCRRCLEIDSSCVFLPAAPRQRRRRTDARVSSLEKELEEMKLLVQRLQGSQIQPGKSKSSKQSVRNPSRDGESSSALPGGSSASAAQGESLGSVPGQDSRLSPEGPTSDSIGSPCTSGTTSEPDIIPGVLQSGLISKETAIQLFKDFVKYSLPMYPAVSLKEEDDFELLRYSRPVLLLATICASSGDGNPELFRALTDHLRRLLVNQIFIEGRKSLELIHAIVIFVFWQCPPENLKNLSFFQWIHIAGTMALQLGIDWKSPNSAPGDLVDLDREPVSEVQMEKWRTMFSVWETCSSCAISLQKRPLIDFTPAAYRCLSAYEKSVTTENDKRLIAWVKLQLISQEIEALKVDFLHKKESGLVDSSSTLVATAEVEKRFMEWESALEPGVMSESLAIHHTFCRMKLHELAMQQEFNLDDLLPPFLDRSKSMAPRRRTQKAEINPSYVRALLSLINACHTTLDTILGFDVKKLRRCPTVTLIRAVYAVKALSMIRDVSKRTGSDISKVIDDEDLRFDYYVNALINHYGAVSGDIKRNPSNKIQGVLRRIAASQRVEPSNNVAETQSSIRQLLARSAKLTTPVPLAPPEETERPEVTEPNIVENNLVADLPMFDYPESTDPLWTQNYSEVVGDGSYGDVGQMEPNFNYLQFENVPGVYGPPPDIFPEFAQPSNESHDSYNNYNSYNYQ